MYSGHYSRWHDPFGTFASELFHRYGLRLESQSVFLPSILRRWSTFFTSQGLPPTHGCKFPPKPYKNVYCTHPSRRRFVILEGDVELLGTADEHIVPTPGGTRRERDKVSDVVVWKTASQLAMPRNPVTMEKVSYEIISHAHM